MIFFMLTRFYTGHVPQTRLPALGLPPYRVFTLEEIEDITKNFDPSNVAAKEPQAKVRNWFKLRHYEDLEKK